eukprot:Gb_17922 [translate_table: standard]
MYEQESSVQSVVALDQNVPLLTTEKPGFASSKWDQVPVNETLGNLPRKEKRKTMKKLKRKALRREAAEKERAEEEARLNDPSEQLKTQLEEQAEAEALERERKEHEERERLWLENQRKAMEEAQQKQQEELERQQAQKECQKEEEENWEYIEEGPAEIIWQGNEIIVRKKRVRVPKGNSHERLTAEDSNRPTSNPLPPQSAAFEDYKKVASSSMVQKVYEGVEQQVPNFGTEQDKAHCPFHIKTGACRFGARCSRAHFYPDKSCTLLMKNMYNGPGLTWEQDEGLEVCNAYACMCLLLDISSINARWSKIFSLG